MAVAVTTVKKSRKAFRCDKGHEIPAGSTYMWWSASRFDPQHIRCMEHPPLPHELETGRQGQLSKLKYEAHQAVDAETTVADVATTMGEFAGRLREFSEEMNEAFENMPEGLQEGEVGQNLTTWSEAMESAADELENWEADEPSEEDLADEINDSEILEGVKEAAREAIDEVELDG